MPSQDVNNDSSPSDTPATNSVPLVSLVFPSALQELGVESLSAKCSDCKQMVEKHWVKIMPSEVFGEMGALEILKITKRLTLCTNCGHMSLTN